MTTYLSTAAVGLFYLMIIGLLDYFDLLPDAIGRRLKAATGVTVLLCCLVAPSVINGAIDRYAKAKAHEVIEHLDKVVPPLNSPTMTP